VFLLFNTLYYRFVEGRAYSDMLDAWLIFFIMASVMLMLRAKEKGRLLDWLAAGLVGGLAFLSKTYLGLTPLGICGILFIAGVTRRIERSPRFLDSLVFTGGYLLAALPINIIHYHSCPK
jgi:4-amino-4-deoxy-L-arabinose transferase-like glycosyltransferase